MYSPLGKVSFWLLILRSEDNVYICISVYHKLIKVIYCFLLIEGVIAGGVAGVVVETALYPIDTIKTRLQAMFYLLYIFFFEMKLNKVVISSVSIIIVPVK